MDTASFQFVFFGLAAALVSNFGGSRAWRSIVLMAASLVFPGLLSHDLFVFLPLAGFLLLGYGSFQMLERGWYVWLKKCTFLPEGVFLHSPYFTLGLSSIFFRVLHLVIEAGDGQEKRHIGLGVYSLYALNFASFVSGPPQNCRSGLG